MEMNWLSVLIAVVLMVISSLLINYRNRLNGASCGDGGDDNPDKKCLGGFDNMVFGVSIFALLLALIYFSVLIFLFAKEHKLHEKASGLGGALGNLRKAKPPSQMAFGNQFRY